MSILTKIKMFKKKPQDPKLLIILPRFGHVIKIIILIHILHILVYYIVYTTQ